MRGCLQVVAVFVAILFVIVAAVAVLVLPLVDAVTDRDAMKDALTGLDTIILEAAPALVADSLAAQARANGFPDIVIDEVLVGDALEDLMPPGWVDAQTETAVNTVYDVLESGDLENAELVLDARPLLEQMRGPAGERLVATIVAGVPDCTEPLDPAAYLGSDVSIPSCVPVEIPRQVIVDEVHAQFVQTLDANPELIAQSGELRVPLFEVMQGDDPNATAAREQFLRVSRTLTLVQRWGWLLWLFATFSLLMIAMLAVRSLSELGHWWGWPLFLTGALVLLLTFVGPGLVGLVGGTLALSGVDGAVSAPSAASLAQPIRELVQSVLVSVTALWRSRVYLQAGIMLGAGLILIAVGFLAPSKQGAR